MSVELDPPELGFRRPFTHEVTQVLRLRNTNKEPVAFKVKTTAPKQYCVRPNSGRIEAGRDVEIQVLLQAMKEDPPLDARCRDKFLVQSVPISPEQEMPNVASIWQNIEKTAKTSIQERKIRVSFLPARDDLPANNSSTPQHHSINGTGSQDEAPPAYVSPFGSPASGAISSNDRSAGPAATANTSNNSLPTTEMSSSTSASAYQQQPPQEKSQSMLGAATSTVADTASSVSAALQSQLDTAKETIVNLKKQMEEQGLRQRKSDAVVQDSRERISTGTTGMGVHQQGADGVPVQIVAALCLLSFLLAYFFF